MWARRMLVPAMLLCWVSVAINTWATFDGDHGVPAIISAFCAVVSLGVALSLTKLYLTNLWRRR